MILLVSGWITVSALAGAPKPNVLFIAMDDLRNCAGAFGDPLARTPSMDALAERGTVFRNAHCQMAICNPSRASVMTGLRPDTIQVWGLKKHFRQGNPGIVTLPELFKKNGYYTHAIGKLYHGQGAASEDPPSWSDQPQFDHTTKGDAYVLKQNRTGGKAAATECADVADNAYIDGKVADAAIRKLRELKRSARPFFLAVGFRKPHMPFTAPARYWDLHDRAALAEPSLAALPAGAPPMAAHDWPEARGYTDIPRKGAIPQEKVAELRHGYYAATSFVDAQLGKVLDELKRQKLDGNTIILLYGDHGFHVGEQNLWGKLTNYDTATRAPLLIAHPKQKDKGAVINRAVEFLDIYPTLAALCGLEAPSALEGKSLAAVLDGRHGAVKNFAVSQFPRPVSYNFTRKRPENMGYSIRTERYRYTRWVEFKTGKLLAEEFYDLKTGRIEEKNEFNNPVHAETIKGLKQKLTKVTGVAMSRPDRPNVLFIAIDDMNDGITLFGKDRPFKTPRIEALAERGVFFNRAYCASAACNPSRAAVLTGLRPHKTGVYGNKTDWRVATRGHLTIPEYFGRHGYYTAGFGKIYHHHRNGAFNDPEAWDVFKKMDPQYMPEKKLNGAPGYGSRNTDWGPWPEDGDEPKTIDFKSVGYAIEVLKQRHDRPFFLACGIFKPHSPFFAPPRYHALYDEALPMPLLKVDDWSDLPSGAAKLLNPKKWFWKGMMALEKRKPGSYRNFIRAYAACSSFADASVGRLVEALDQSGHAGNTIVVLWSDHGFHLGEKDHIEKFALWEKANHVPLIIVDPRRKASAGKTCCRPIDLTTLFPTLIDLCGLPAYDRLDGRSVAGLVADPQSSWQAPALMTYGLANHAVRTERWRYIRYADGSEELYDHERDPNEWTNLAADPAYRETVAEHKRWMPTANAKPYGDLK